jgi:outer membrane protein OmpA-like peptidoglycan-associated protein
MRTRTWLLALVCSTHGATLAQEAPSSSSAPAPGQTLSFIACPIYRDTDAGRKSGCWLADDPASGRRYDITFGPVKPQVGRAVLVEGVTTSDATDPAAPCGGAVLTPVRIAVLPETCARTIIPAEGHPGRPYKSPPEQLRPMSEPRVLPPPPYDPRVFTIYFEHGRDFLIYQYAEMIIEKIALYAKASQAKQVSIEGFAASEPWTLPSPRGPWTVRESQRLAQTRAEMVAEALRRLGVPESSLRLSWQSAAAANPDLEGGKLPEASKRRVVISIVP